MNKRVFLNLANGVIAGHCSQKEAECSLETVAKFSHFVENSDYNGTSNKVLGWNVFSLAFVSYGKGI